MSAPSPLPDEGKAGFDEHMLSVLESLHDGFMSVSHSWCCTYVNRVAENMLQKRREDLLGKNLREVFPEFVNAVFWEKCYEAVETRSVKEVEEVYTPAATRFAVRIAPSEAGIALFFHEGTAQSQNTHDTLLDDQRSPIQASLIERAQDAIIVRDQTNTIISWNQGAERLYGWTWEEAVGRV